MSLYQRQLSRTSFASFHFLDHDEFSNEMFNLTIAANASGSLFQYNQTRTPSFNQAFLNFILILNACLPYFYGILGTALNLFLIVTYRLKDQKELHKHHITYFCFANQMNVVLFFLGNTFFIGFSTLNCKLFTYLIHIFSTYTVWILANGTFVLKCQVNKQMIRLDLNRKFLLVMPFLIGLFYSSDLFYLKL